MTRFLVYNFSGELDDISHLFPNERLARIAAIVRKHGGEVDLLDRANFIDLQAFGQPYMQNLGNLGFYDTNPMYQAKLEEEAKLLLAGGYDVVFLNLWHGTGFKFSMDLARLLKAGQPSMTIYGIGQKVDWFNEHILTLSDNVLDGLVMGLGYDAIERLVQGEAPATCTNMIALQDGKPVVNARAAIDVDEYPLGIYDEDVYRHIGAKLPLHTISLSNQACPNNCVFCVRPANYGKTNIPRDISLVLAEMLESYRRYGIRMFRFEDSTPPRLALTEISRAIVNSEMNGQIHFTAFSRIDTNCDEDFALLKQAGCSALFFGVESFNDDNLLRLRKGITYAAIKETVRKAHDAGIRTLSNLIVPIPGETQESLEIAFARIGECREIFDSIMTLPGGVYPPTEWGMDPARFDILLDADYLERLVTYPIKYLYPLKFWPPFPFRYGLLGKGAAEVTPGDLVAVHEEFSQRIRQTYGIPPIPDYAFLLADYLGQPYLPATQQIIGMMVNGDYAGLEALLLAGVRA